MSTIRLHNGMAMPTLGLGTFRLSPEDCERAVATALECGYRLVDTANVYMNERAVARGIAASGVPRDQVVVQTKLWPTCYRRADAAAAIDATLRRLDTDYVDVLLLHQPAGRYLEAWDAMQEAVGAGKVRTLGLSNFDARQLHDVMTHADVQPAVMQLECHPYRQLESAQWLLEGNGIALQAWYPLGHGDARLLADPTIVRIAGHHGRTPAQVVLRWHVQSHRIAVPGSHDPAHIRENLAIGDFELDEYEMDDLARLDRDRAYFRMPGPLRRVAFTMGRPDFDAQP